MEDSPAYGNPTEKAPVKHVFSKEERAAIADEMAEAVAEAERLKDELKSVQADYKARIQVQEALARTNSQLLKNGYEYREMDCPVEYAARSRTKTLYHPHTGEIVRTADMSEDELQLKLA
jgi:hypothetical protein